MHVLFQSADPQAHELRAWIEQRVRFALRRIAWKVQRVEVRMSDINGPRGGTDKRCQVALHTDGAGSALASGLAPNWSAALERTLARVVRLLIRRRQRGADPRRLRGRTPRPPDAPLRSR
jgi:hypothetical protein